MFQEIREKQGLAYDVRSYFENFADIGAIYTQAGVAIGKTAKALKSITRQYEKVKIDLSEEELQRAKSYLIGQAKIGLEDSYELAEFFIKQRRYIEKVLTPAELFAKIEKVTRREIVAAANRYLDFGKISIAAIGPESVQRDIEKIIRTSIPISVHPAMPKETFYEPRQASARQIPKKNYQGARSYYHSRRRRR